MAKLNEKKFYTALENIFVGANIEGDSGYVNLLKIKSAYYKIILEQFKKDIDKDRIITDDFKEEFFDRLYSFFEKYFSESGSVYFTKTSNWQRVYERVYTDNKDVVLFWKTHMLYYVKSDILFQSINLELIDEETEQDYKFYFDVGSLQAKQNNEKKALVFTFNKKEGETFVFDVAYSERGNKTKIDEVAKALKIPEAMLEKAFAVFKKQSEVDFFINKDAEKFLSEQLDMYLHQILLTDENKFNQTRLDQLKTVKEFAQKIIKFIAQFENELVQVWNKPKFALNSHYVITIDKLSENIIKKIIQHTKLKDQIKEWVELGMVEKDFDFKKREDKHKYLPIDTKYFKDLEIEILGLFDHLDEALDGRLIHSENYQALNTLQAKYKEKVQCIYIDPPFNTGSDFAYVDKFQDSTWLTLMSDRIALAKNFLRDDGSFYLHLDDNADHLGRMLTDSIFDKNNLINQIVWYYSDNFQGNVRGFANNHDNIFWYGKSQLTETQKVMIPLDKPTMRDKRIWSKEESKLVAARDENGKLIYSEFTHKKADDVWLIGQSSTTKRAAGEYVDFDTQKPEELMRRIFLASSSEGSYIMDFFSGSATTIATAHKLGRKWIGVEMGEHFNDVDIPRMKTVLSGKISGISKDLEKDGKLKKGGFFKYEKLEQYEDTLRNMKYKESTPSTIFDTRKPFEQYVFYADQKFAQVVEIKKTKEDIDLDFEKLYPNIDFAETISNIKGLPIQKITATGVLLEGEEREIKTDYKNMTQSETVEFIKLLKPLLWWGG